MALIVKAAEQGHVDSQALVGWCYRFGLMGDEKPKIARNILLRWLGIIGNEANNCRWLGLEHNWSMNARTSPLPPPAVKWFELAAKQGHLYAATMLWGHYFDTEGPEAKRTLHYHTILEKSNDLPTNVMVALAMATKPEQSRYARELIEQRMAVAKEETDPDVLRIMQNAYNSGMFVEKDEKLGRKLRSLELDLRRRMHNRRDPNNLYNLSLLLAEDGNVKKALHWLELAAVGGHPRAQQALGLAYHAGRGVPKSAVFADYWLSRAAKQGLDTDFP